MSSTLELRYTGGASNADPNASLGGVMSSVTVATGAMNNLFDNVTPTEATAGDTEYRAVDLYNSGDAAAEDVTVWFDIQTPSPDSLIEVGLDSTTQTVVDENTAPSGVTFSAPTEGSPLSVSDINASAAQRIWFRRTITALADNYAQDNFSMTVQYA